MPYLEKRAKAFSNFWSHQRDFPKERRRPDNIKATDFVAAIINEYVAKELYEQQPLRPDENIALARAAFFHDFLEGKDDELGDHVFVLRSQRKEGKVLDVARKIAREVARSIQPEPFVADMTFSEEELPLKTQLTKPVAQTALEVPTGQVQKAEEAYLCRDSPELFFSPYRTDIAEAKRLCGRCAVRNSCLEKGLKVVQSHEGYEGIYGGLTPAEIMTIKRRSQRANQRAS